MPGGIKGASSLGYRLFGIKSICRNTAIVLKATIRVRKVPDCQGFKSRGRGIGVYQKGREGALGYKGS